MFPLSVRTAVSEVGRESGDVRNLLIVSMVIFLTATVSTAPVEEKEQEEAELETPEEVEGELSEEEEDDDDSKSQDKIDEAGLVGVQQTAAVAAAAAAAASGDSTAGEQSSFAASHSSGFVGSSSSPAAAAAAAAAAAEISTPQHAAADHPAASSHPETNGSDGVDSESNGNGQKLLNGGGGDSQTGVLGAFEVGVSHLDYTGTIDSSSHDFLFDLMGGRDPFGPDVHINIPGHVTAPTQLDSSVISLGVTAGPAGSPSDSSSDHAHHSDVINQPEQTSLSSGAEESPLGSAAGSHQPAAQGDGADSPDANGNRQILLTDANSVTDRLVSLSDQTDLTGGAESVTGRYLDLTASGLGLGHDVTESSTVVLVTETADATSHTPHPGLGAFSSGDLVSMAADTTGTDSVSADPTGNSLDSSHPAVTDRTQTAGSVTEQYNPSGQGPEGAENVELEDTC